MIFLILACVTLADRVLFKDFNMISGVWFHLCLTLVHLANVPDAFADHFDTYLVEPYETPISVHILYALHFVHALLSALYDPYANSVAIKTHHVVHMFLLLVSYVFGYIPIGTVVMFVHDFSDIFMFAMRKWERHENPIKYTLYVALLVLWAHGRIIKFNEIIQRGWLTQNQFGQAACLIALRVLWCLNVFWFVQLVRRGYRAIMREF